MSVLGEDVEDQCNAVHDVALERMLEVALLCGAQVVVEHNDVDVLGVRDRDELLELAASDECRCCWVFTTYQDGFDRF